MAASQQNRKHTRSLTHSFEMVELYFRDSEKKKLKSAITNFSSNGLGCLFIGQEAPAKDQIVMIPNRGRYKIRWTRQTDPNIFHSGLELLINYTN